jgi:AraC family transcriptional regulator of adaptative response/methylated-DNA-[protein]-cysteine methyltransferase
METHRNDYTHIPYCDTLSNTLEVDKHHIAMSRINTPFGDLLAGATTKGLCLLEFTDTQRIEIQLSRLKKQFNKQVVSANSEYFPLLLQQLNAYFKGELYEFSIPLDICGTAFQQQVWEALQTIPYAETRSYQQQAIAIGNPKAVRAVANANRNNKMSILIPCHRVIGKNGSMTGYGGGIWRKQYLLDLEKKHSI